MTDYTATYVRLMSMSLKPDEFLSEASEAFFKAEQTIHEKYRLGQRDMIPATLGEFLLIGRAYRTALRQKNLWSEYQSALLTAILTVDITGVDIRDFAPQVLSLHSEFLIELGRMVDFHDEDEFAMAHLKCIIRMESAIFRHIYSILAPMVDDPLLLLTAQGQDLAADTALAGPAPEGCLPVEPVDVKSLLIDIYSRFAALR